MGKSKQQGGPEAREWIRRLELTPHPEGGYYREIYRSPGRFGARSFSTAIYYLLEAGDFSAFHSLTSDEIWHHYAGSALELYLLGPGGSVVTALLGNNPAEGASPCVVIPAGTIFAAEPSSGAGGFSLVGCTVSPGFEFADFTLRSRRELLERFPSQAALIRRLTREGTALHM